MMEKTDQELRLECLDMAIRALGADGRSAYHTNVIEAADRFYAFAKGQVAIGMSDSDVDRLKQGRAQAELKAALAQTQGSGLS